MWKKGYSIMDNAHKITEFEKYAIIETGGKQYQALPGKTICIEKIEGQTGDKVEFNNVLFRKTDDAKFEFGTPFIMKASVTASIVKQDKAPKVISFKFQRRHKVRTKKGHRQPQTIVRIESI
jgi:large subunit ribosomal protein L21